MFAALAASAMAAEPSIKGIDSIKVCGRLNVMKAGLEDLTEGIRMEDFRMCADHPLGYSNYYGWGDYILASLVPGASDLWFRVTHPDLLLA
ncbi:hypothetical protein MY10362_003743 [Beauveria mimosiformis]